MTPKDGTFVPTTISRYFSAILLLCSIAVIIGTSSCAGFVSAGNSTPATATPLALTTAALPAGTARVAYSAELSATGGTTPYTWSLTSGSLPTGVSLTAATGLISGTPTASGTFSFTVQVKDSSSPALAAAQQMTITISSADAPLQITTSLLAAGQAGSSYSVVLGATGGTTPYTWSLTSGSLPTGVSLTAATGLISGTPTTSGTFSFTVQVKDSSSPAQTATANLSITVSTTSSPVQVVTSSLSNGQVSSAYSATLAATGGTTPYTWSLTSGSLPTGVSLTAATGLISGTPTTSGTFSFTVQVKDSSSPAQTATANLSITVSTTSSPVQVVTSSLSNGQVSSAYSATLAATGGTTPYTWSLTSGSLPTGVSLTAATGLISGTPTTSGAFSFTVQVKDSSSPAQTATANLSITVSTTSSPVQVVTSSLSNGQVSSAYSATLAATGGTTPYTWSLTSGSLPTGVSLTAATGLISGTPTTSGTFSFTVQVKDSSSPAQTATANLSITVSTTSSPVQVVTSSLSNGQVSSAYSATLAATGGKTPYTWSLTSGSLPTGVSLTAATGLISGTPTTSGTFSFTVQVKDSSSPAQTATANLSITVSTTSSPVQVVTSSLSNGQVSSAYSATLAATGGTTPYTWSLTSGSLPTGVSLTAATGLISGTPTTSGTFSFTVQVKDSSSPAQTATANLSITVSTTSSPVQVVTSSLSNGQVSSAYSATLAATGGTTPYTWSLTSGSLPTGVSLTAATGLISGTPTTSGTFSFTVQVKDSSSPAQTATANLSITVSTTSSPVQVVTSSLSNGQVSSAYSATLAATGGTTPYTWSLTSGSLPTGVSLTAATGLISGTPTTSGTFSFTVQVKDSSSPAQTATANLSITVSTTSSPVQVVTSSLSNGQVSSAYSATLAATGGTTPYTWSLTSGSLPTGVSLTAATGLISGTPTTSGTFSFTVQVKDSSSPAQTATANLSITVNASASPVEITTDSLPDGAVSSVYSATLAATGGAAPYTWSLTSGSLPTGVSLTAATGLISGTPTTSGTFSFTVQVKDSSSPAQTAIANLSILIDSGSSSNCPTGKPCGVTAPSCTSYTPPSTSGATAITSLPYTISSSGNYYLSSSFSGPSAAPSSAITVNASNVDINLNGKTLTYGSGGNQSNTTSNVAQFAISGSGRTNVTIENGTITQLSTASGYDNTPNCKGAGVGGNNACAAGGNSGDSYASTFSHVINQSGGSAWTIQHVVFNWQTVASNAVYSTGTGDTVQCNTFNNGVVHIDNRSQIEGASINMPEGEDGSTGDTIRYNTIVGGPQGGILATDNNSIVEYNDINVGSGASGSIQYSNDFSIYCWAVTCTSQYNYVHAAEGRCIGSLWEPGQTNLIETGDYMTGCAEYQNNYEYGSVSNSGGSPGCEYNGSLGLEYEGGAVVTLTNEHVETIAGPPGLSGQSWNCEGIALGDFSFGNGSSSTGSTYIGHAGAGFTGGAGSFEYEASAFGLYLNGTQIPGTFTSTNDTFIGDSSVIWDDYDGLAAAVTLISPTLGKGTNPVNFNTFRFENYADPMCAHCLVLQDPTFLNGAGESDVDWSYCKSGGSTCNYEITWTFNLTVVDSNSNPVVGASVTITGADSVEQGGTLATNTSGQISIVLSERYASVTNGGTPSIVIKTPFAVSISATGCTTLNYSQDIDATTSVTKNIIGTCGAP